MRDAFAGFCDALFNQELRDATTDRLRRVGVLEPGRHPPSAREHQFLLGFWDTADDHPASLAEYLSRGRVPGGRFAHRGLGAAGSTLNNSTKWSSTSPA